MSFEYTPAERKVIEKASKAVGGLNDDATPAQLDRFARVAAEQRRMAEPVISKVSTPVITKGSDAARVAARIELLTKMSTSPAYSPRINKVAARALKLAQNGGSLHEAEKAAWMEEVDSFADRAEEMKALKVARANAAGADAPIVRKAITEVIQKRLAEDLSAITQKRKH